MKKAVVLAAATQGRRVVSEVKHWAEQPENRERLRDLGQRVLARRSPGWPQPPRDER